MNHCFQRLAAPVRNRQGVAFPVALLGILGVSVTVTAVLLTATTESALSSAHKDATRDLYVSQGAVEAYVATLGMNLAPVTDLSYLAPGAPEANRTRITVQQVGSVPVDPALNLPPDAPPNLLFSVQAQPTRGGRAVVSFARIMSRPFIDTDINSAVTVGKDIEIKGNSTVSDGSDSQICDQDLAADYALQATAPATASWGNNTTRIGDEGSLDIAPQDLIQSMFGVTLQDLIAAADIKFGPSPLTPFGSTSVTSLGSVANPTNPQATSYNWGCPADMFLNNQGLTACEPDTDKTYMPIVAINAATAPNSTVTVNLSHGQGMLIVYNGNLRVQGNLIFKGVIIVEGVFDVMASGGGATSPKIEGALIGLGINSGGAQAAIDHDIAGTPTIRFNRCAINAMQGEINVDRFRRVVGPTSSWFEVVR